MLNETHELPHHRVLAHSLLPYLERNHYNYIGCEALNNDPSSYFATNGLINTNSAIYTKEPYFANFINAALSENFNVISYEPVSIDHSQWGLRDSFMCDNIINKWNPDNGKLLIYCGWAHLNNTKNWLRRYLQNKLPNTKIVSLNQSWLNNEHPSEIQDKIRKQLVNIKVPSIVKSGKNYYTLDDAYDVEIIHPKYTSDYINISSVYREYKSVNIELPNDKLYDYLLVYDDKITTNLCEYVPSAVVNNLQNKLSINLPKGNYIMYLSDMDRMVFYDKITVE